MKPICLINPPSIFLLDERTFISLGILRVAAVLEQAGHTVEHLDLNGIENYVEAVKDHVSRTEATTFGLTATTPQIPATAKIVQAIRAVNPGAKIILGGPHITLVNAAVKREAKLGLLGRAHRAYGKLADMFDVLVAGDGEAAVFEAIKDGALKLVDADSVDSVLWMTNQIYDETPFPARHLVDVGSYHYTIDGVPALSMIAQLGCPFACGFCGGRESAMLRRIRTRSTANILQEIEHIYRTYSVTGIMCYDSETEILTEANGFVKFAELSPSDRVATLDPETEEMRFEVPQRIIRMPFTGNLVTIKSKRVDLAVTPEHRMWVRRNGTHTKYEHLPADELAMTTAKYNVPLRAKWQGDTATCFHIPAYTVRYLGRNRGSPKVVDGERCFPAALWVRFMAWYLAEGSCYKPKIRNGGHGYRICIKQDLAHNPAHVDEVRGILDELGYRYSYSSNQFHIDSRELYEYLSQFGTSLKKHVPPEFKRMQSELQLLFIKTYLKGDGYVSKDRQEVIVSYSKRMRDDLQEMAIKAGYWATCPELPRVLLSPQREHMLNDRRNPFGTMPYSGEVHCVTVSTGIVLVRRNGRAVWCGNCYDDELNVSKSMVELMNGIADLGQSLGVDFRLRGFIKSQLFTDEQAEAMYRAGFRWILVGFESGSPRILENINKKATREENSRCMAIARRHGLKVKALMSVGHPGESEETIRQTHEWLLQERPDDFDCTTITVYPGTPYYDHAYQDVFSPSVWTYRQPKTGDTLHSYEIDFLETADYYKGDPEGGYRAYVFTDYLKSEDIVRLRDWVERDVRAQLGIPFNAGQPGVRFEASMGQLPGHILRKSESANRVLAL